MTANHKIKASVIVIGFGKEVHSMYPHLYDFMHNMKEYYADVIYIEDNDRGLGLYLVDCLMQNILYIFDFKNTFRRIFYAFKGQSIPETAVLEKKFSLGIFFELLVNLFFYLERRRGFINKIKNPKLKFDQGFVLAIDHISCLTAERHFPGKVIFWSNDILTRDCSRRIKGGFLEKMITSKNALKSKVLIIQDEQRKRVLEESVGAVFPKIIYLPVSLNDSEFCKKAAGDRLRKVSFSTVNIIQAGQIAKGRWSEELIEVYQNWPDQYKLCLHGSIGEDIKRKFLNIKRPPIKSEVIYNNDSFPEFLDKFDIGFVGYAVKDSNHRYIENASAQMVQFLRLGIPVIGCGAFLNDDLFKDFINRQVVGIGICRPEEMVGAIGKIIENYSFFSRMSRRTYESRYNLRNIFDKYLINEFKEIFMGGFN